MGKHKKSREYSSDSEASSDSEEIEKSRKQKKSKKHKSKKKKRKHSSSSDSEDAWVEKNVDKSDDPAPTQVKPKQRDDWMSADNFFIPTFTKEKRLSKSAVEKANHQIYDPATNSRELNPYFKTGEGGMPSFQRPKEFDDDDYDNRRRGPAKMIHSSSSMNWKKSRHEEVRHRREKSRSESPEEAHRVILPEKPPIDKLGITASHSDFLTDEQMNTIGAKMIKAELMGNEALAGKLKGKLEKAKAFKSSGTAAPQTRDRESVVLSITNAAGTSRPVTQDSERKQRPQDRKKNKRVETHQDGERTKYYADDGKYDIKQMVSVQS